QLPGLGKIYMNQAIGFDFALLEEWWSNVAICDDTTDANPNNGVCDCADGDEDGFCDCPELVRFDTYEVCCNDATCSDGSYFFPGYDALPTSGGLDWSFAGCSLLTGFSATDDDGFPASP